jgi:hypothetical protein
MPIFTYIATTVLGLAAGSFFATAVASGLALATTYALSYAAKALAGNPKQDAAAAATGGVQGTLAAGADVPRSFQLGYSMTAGSLVYANTWGTAGQTPNAYLTQVIALSDLPGCTLQGFWVNGEKCTIAGTDFGMGTPVTQYNKVYPIGAIDHLWIKYYDGNQTTADGFLTGTVSSATRPYQSTRVGKGVCYAIVTAMVDDTLFTGFPTFKFELSGIPLYDPTKDSTNGGSGSHLWSNPATWGGDGDNFPAVQAYNILRGIYYQGQWLYGLQLMTAARLPNVNWNAQIAKCRATITGVSGPEPTYRTGGQVSVDTPPLDIIEKLLTGCQGRLSEIGGFYKIHLGTPDSPTFSFTDNDILSTEEQEFTPFFGLADSINGIAGTYPAPSEAWNMKPAPPLYNSTYEVQDGSRRLLASPVFDFVPYDAQVQRLQKSALQEARRARRHSISMSPAWWIVEPGDVGQWSSNRNGYVNKQFRVDGITDRANLDVVFNITEVDPTDYSWNHATDFQGFTIGPTVFPRPAPQGIVDWYAEPWTLYDDTGTGRRAAIRLAWDGTLPGLSGVQWEARNGPSHPSAPGLVVNRGRTDQLAAGAIIISQNLVSNTLYEVRGQYIPSSPRDMLWSSWLTVTTPNIDQTIDQTIRTQVTLIENYLNDQVNYGMQQIAAVASNMHAGNWIDDKTIREELVASSAESRAAVTQLQTVRLSDQVAFASYQTSVTAQFNATNASVTTNASAIATLNGYAAAQYSVTLDVNGYATGFNLFNGGAGISTATFVVDKFQIASPGVGGGAAVPIFTVANVAGSPKIAVRGDMYADGTIYADALVSGTITSDSGKIGALSVKSLSIAGNAATVPNAQSYSSTITSTPTTFANFTMSIDTTGLSGVSITIWAIATCIIDNFGTGNSANCSLIMNGSTQASITGLNWKTAMMVLSAAITITGSGGVMSVPVSFQANVLASTFSVTGSLFAICAKR